jgi:PIN domain nuclease of toxin-antitoxin system
MESFLLDTMSVLWMAFRPDLLSPGASARIRDSSAPLVYSVVSMWEIGLKMSRGGYRDFILPADWDVQIPEALALDGIRELAVSPRHCRRIQDLHFHHKDPFDRMLIAQSLVEDLSIIGCDEQFDDYGVKRVW